MTAQHPGRHMTPVDASPRDPARAGAGASSRWQTGLPRRLITIGLAAANAVPVTILTAAISVGARPAMIAVTALAAFVIACATATVTYQARQETRRKQMDLQAHTDIACAFAAVIDDVHRHADHPADKDSVAEAARVRTSARKFLADHHQDLTRLTERPQP